MSINELISRRFAELEKGMDRLQIIRERGEMSSVESGPWHEWATSAASLLEGVLGADSVHARHFRAAYDGVNQWGGSLDRVKGVFRAAKADYDGGYVFGLEKVLSGEIIFDFVALAKVALQEGNKDVAAVLASAALEDALKRYARQIGLDVDDRVMQEVVSALKSKGLVSGAQKSLLETMPKLRDYAMHANWDKLTHADVGSIIGFVEPFLIGHFS
jgi:hypothetical protein